MQFAINLIPEYLFMDAIDLVTFSFIMPGIIVGCGCLSAYTAPLFSAISCDAEVIAVD